MPPPYTAQSDLSQPLRDPASEGVKPASDDLSFPDHSINLVPFTGPPSPADATSSLCAALFNRPSLACPEWLDESPSASQLVHRIEELSKSQSEHLSGYSEGGLRPLDTALPQLLFESPSLPYLAPPQYALLVERYNEAAKDQPGDVAVFRALFTSVCVSMTAILAVAVLYAVYGVLVLAVGMPLAVLWFVLSVGLLFRHACVRRQRTIRRMLTIVRSANVELDSCYEQAVAVAVAGGRGEGQHKVRRCQWRWLSTSDTSTHHTLCLVLVDQPQHQEGMTL